MLLKTIKLPNLTDVYDFHKQISQVGCDIDMLAVNSKYCVDAKSIMGIFSMDLTQPVIIQAHTDDPEKLHQIETILFKYEVDNG